MRTLQPVVLVAALALTSVAAAGPAAAATPTGTWNTVSQTVNRPTLNAIDAVTGSDVWAVGQGADYLAYAQHWNGLSWNAVPVPSDPGSYLSALNGVAVVSATDVWAVGDNQSGRALIVHWNGSAWTRAALPALSGYTSLAGVSAVSATDIWAVGTTQTNRTLTLHYNGNTWAVVASPSPSTNTIPYNFLYGVHARASDDVWAVGTYSLKGQSPQTLTLRWDGATWRRVATPALKAVNGQPVYSRLNAVVATGSGAAWAVGTVGNQPLAMRWNGTQWAVVATAGVDLQNGFLRSVDAAAADDVWAVGDTQRVFQVGDSEVYKSTTFITHFDGRSWATFPSPNPVPDVNLLRGVSVVSPNQVWASGSPGLTMRYTAP